MSLISIYVQYWEQTTCIKGAMPLPQETGGGWKTMTMVGDFPQFGSEFWLSDIIGWLVNRTWILPAKITYPKGSHLEPANPGSSKKWPLKMELLTTIMPRIKIHLLVQPVVVEYRCQRLAPSSPALLHSDLSADLWLSVNVLHKTEGAVQHIHTKSHSTSLPKPPVHCVRWYSAKRHAFNQCFFRRRRRKRKFSLTKIN